MKSFAVVNEWAMYSCPRWNPNRLTRHFYRKKYRDAAIDYMRTKEYKGLRKQYNDGNHGINTYPWPYSCPDFANWKEDDTPDGYSLISDQSGCVIRYATSYCAFKIYETTGTWPQKTSNDRLDAKRWQQFLAEAGYTEVLPAGSELSAEHCYVGIKPDEGEWGLVVWADSGEDPDEYWATITTYYNKEFKVMAVDPREYTWVLIK